MPEDPIIQIDPINIEVSDPDIDQDTPTSEGSEILSPGRQQEIRDAADDALEAIRLSGVGFSGVLPEEQQRRISEAAWDAVNPAIDRIRSYSERSPTEEEQQQSSTEEVSDQAPDGVTTDTTPTNPAGNSQEGAGDAIDTLDPADRNALRDFLRRSGQERLYSLSRMLGDDALILGPLVFRVPPTSIRIQKSNITYRWKPLRTKESIAVKSGNGECYIEIDLAFVGLHQINNSLSVLVSVFKKNPFCFVENAFIRSQIIPNQPDKNMALQLKSLIAQTVPGQTNAVYVTLVTKWFNYLPYSQHFWFREQWIPIGTTSTSRPNTNNERSSSADANEEIVDLSQTEEPAELNQSHPPEFRTTFLNPSNPGDPLIRPTQPVTYPFNSKPYMDYILRGQDSPQRISEWNDKLTMNWNSYMRIPVPGQYEIRREVNQFAARPPTATRSDNPPPVTGDRDVILWTGDSIMIGITAMRDTNINDVREITSSRISNDTTDNYENYVAAKAGIGTAAWAEAWNTIKENENFTRSSTFDRVAYTVIHISVNDGPTSEAAVSRTIENIRPVIQEMTNYGSNVVLLSPLPLGDSESREGQLGDSVQAQLDNLAGALHTLANDFDRAVFLDYRSIAAAEEDLTRGWNIPYRSEYRQITAGKINLHPNPSGYTAIAGFVASHLEGYINDNEDEEANLWRVCEVDDGDTFTACNGNEVKTIRVFGIDTPETYSDIEETTINGVTYTPEQLRTWLPHGQDSWRPEGKQFGTIAKRNLSSLLGVDTDNPMVTLEFKGTGQYGRDLAIVTKGDTNINLEMLRQGLAYFFANNLSSEERRDFVTAYVEGGGTVQGYQVENISRRRPQNIFDSPSTVLVNPPPDLPDAIRTFLQNVMYPGDWRNIFPSAEDSSVEPENCCEEDE